MIDLNYSFFLQLINFLILMFLLSRFVFNPIRAFLKEREDRRNNWIQGAQHDREKAETMKADYDRQLNEARQKARSLQAEMIESEEKRAVTLKEQVRAEEDEKRQQGKAALAEDRKTSEKALRVQISKLADAIVKQVTVKS